MLFLPHTDVIGTKPHVFFSVVVLTLFENLEKVQIALNTNEGERNGSVVKCLTQDREAGVSSLTGVTAVWSLSKTHLS